VVAFVFGDADIRPKFRDALLWECEAELRFHGGGRFGKLMARQRRR
jgi:hypothetical protein